jgi:signal transduction histidine kinase
MNPVRPDTPLPRNKAALRWRAALRARLQAMGVAAAPEPDDAAVQRVLDADTLLAQFVRASRHSSGTVRAFSSLIADAHEDDGDTMHWLSRVERAAAELDEVAARMSTLRICQDERPVSAAWGEVFSGVAARCGGIAPCTIEAIDRSRTRFCQRAELLGRTLFHAVRNAMEASPRGAIVRIRVDETRHEGARLFHVRVSDDGPGIDPAIAPSMWEPFVSSRPGHAGLGLPFITASAPILGAAAGVRREAGRTTLHLLVGEEGGLQWE